MAKASIDNVLVDKPTNTSVTSEVFSARFRSSGWFEIFVPNGSDPVGTIAIKGGNSKSQSTHHGLEVLSSQVYANGANISGTPFTGLTLSSAGTLSIAADLASDVYIRVPVINMPLYYSVVYTRSSGGSASLYLQVSFHGREAT